MTRDDARRALAALENGDEWRDEHDEAARALGLRADNYRARPDGMEGAENWRKAWRGRVTEARQLRYDLGGRQPERCCDHYDETTGTCPVDDHPLTDGAPICARPDCTAELVDHDDPYCGNDCEIAHQRDQLDECRRWATPLMWEEVARRIEESDGGERGDEPSPDTVAAVRSWWIDVVEGGGDDWDDYGDAFVDRLERGYRRQLEIDGGAGVRYYIRTQRGGETVGDHVNGPRLFSTRAEARAHADEVAPSTPSKYGRLIVSEWRG